MKLLAAFNTFEDHSSLEDHSSVTLSTIQGNKVDPNGVSLGNSSNSNDNQGKAWVGILRGKSAKEKKGGGGRIQAPSHNYQQQFPHGYPAPVHPLGMMPMQPRMTPPGMMPPGMMHPGMMPMQPGAAMPCRMPYMMPPHYDGAPYRAGCHDYACGHPEIHTITTGSDSIYSISTFSSSCSSLLCAEPLAILVLNTVDSFKRSVDDVMEYGEELCDTTTSGDHDVESVWSRRSSLLVATRSTPEDNAELLEKIDKLYTLVTEKVASGKAIKTKDLNPLEEKIDKLWKLLLKRRPQAKLLWRRRI
jgi:hypothetical protein